MKNDVNEILIELIRCVIIGSDLDDDIKNMLASNIPSALFELAAKHDMAHILAEALSKNRLLKEDEISDKFKKAAFLAVMRYELLVHEQEEICAVLEDCGIEYIPLKGAVIRRLYPQPWLRTSCDIDILVRECDLDKAIEALAEKLGCKKKERDYHDVSLITNHGVHLELHFSIRENLENLDRLLEKVWDYSYPADPDSCLHKMEYSYLVFHILAHMSYHFINGGCGIRPFIDLWLLKQNVEYNYKEIKELCAVCGIDTFFDRALRLTQVWFDGHEYDDVSKAMQEYIFYGGVYGAMDNSIAVTRSKSVSRTKYILSRLFLNKSVLSYYYPKLKKHPVLFPYYTVKRWFKMFRPDKAKHAMSEMRVSGNIDNEKVRTIDYLFKELKL